MQTLGRKVCTKSACQIFADVQTFQKSAECAYCRLFQKKYASILQNVCTECMCSAASLHTNPPFFWGKRRVGENADLMHTLCRLKQISCRHDADQHKSVQYAHYLLSCTRWIMQSRCILHTDFHRLYADMMQTFIQECIWRNVLLSYAKYAQGDFLTVLWGLQDLRGVKGTGQCWLLPGSSTGREAGRPRVV